MKRAICIQACCLAAVALLHRGVAHAGAGRHLNEAAGILRKIHSDNRLEGLKETAYDGQQALLGEPLATLRGEASLAGVRAPATHGTPHPAALGVYTPPSPSPGSTLDDASRLNKTRVAAIVKPKTVEDIQDALEYARKNNLKVSMAGARHSMGGQAFFRDALVLDMTEFDAVSLDKARRVVRVQSGATWVDVQSVLKPEGLAVDVMQSPNIFTIGGSLSVNAHGSNPDSGPVSSTVRSVRVLLADGSMVEASREANPELFRLVLGGYGLFGVILEAELEVRENEIYRVQSLNLDYKEFPEFFAKNMAGNSLYGFSQSRLSVAPSSFLKEMSVTLYSKTGESRPEPVRKEGGLARVAKEKLMGAAFSLDKSGPVGKEIFWWLLSKAAPRLLPKEMSRNRLMGEGFDFKTDSPRETQILQEYFVPRANFVAFVDKLRQTVLKHRMNVLWAVVRAVRRDPTPFLTYSDQDRFGVVLFFNQPISEQAGAQMAEFTRDLIDEALEVGAKFYLPYQLAYTQEQLRSSYPEIDSFFDFKRKYDSSELFMNRFYDLYGKGPM